MSHKSTLTILVMVLASSGKKQQVSQIIVHKILYTLVWKVASNRNQSGIRVVLILDRSAFFLAVNFPLLSTPMDFIFPMNMVRFGQGEPRSCIQKSTNLDVLRSSYYVYLENELFVSRNPANSVC